MFAAGLVEEVQSLRAAGKGDTQPVRGGVGYKEVSAYLDGEYDLAEAVRRMKNANHRLVRRQNAWFKENDARIRWLDGGPDATTQSVRAAKEWLEAQGD
jgi:tRNA dimethylallyltransferase